MSSLHISVAPETLFHLGPVPITNALFTNIIVTLFLVGLGVYAAKSTNRLKAIPLTVEIVIEGFYDFFVNIAGKRGAILFPLLFTFFLYIIIANWSGLLPIIGSIGLNIPHGQEVEFIPIFRGPTTDLNTTFALAIISVFSTWYMGIKINGVKGFLSKFLTIRSPIDAVVGLLEMISEFSKLLSFSFRLFGNIFAGEVLIAVMTFLIPLLLPVPFLALEVFVGFIQAIVFTMLTLIFIEVAVESHH
jgi:F-type H+-transporting ATPase subunit a